ncbi:aminotransferase-like domain-containing protein [Brevirhabdus sp.]|uniref:aminotransferase-like domain-containing protein n=1 Tax=Brevirhabdus sp. TaxID=2004514 RepID=UPI004057F4F8
MPDEQNIVIDTINRADLTSGQGPKYRLLSESIGMQIRTGALPPGTRLPPVRNLAWAAGVTPGTVSRAYQLLTDAGLLSAHVGRGTFVADARQRSEVTVAADMDPVIRPLPDRSVPGILDLRSPVLPDVGQVQAIRDALRTVADQPGEHFLDYPSRVTDVDARAALARELSAFNIGPVDLDHVVLSHGGQHALTMIFQAVLAGPRPVILTEELSYAGFRHAARLMRAEVIGIESDAEGPLPPAVAAACQKHDVRIFVTSAEALNPTTQQTTERRRHEIAELARRYDFQILQDECYTLAVSKLPAYRTIAPDRAWYVSSFSKSLSPALRLGYFVAPEGKAEIGQLVARHGFFGLSGPITDVTTRLGDLKQLTEFRARIHDEISWRCAALAQALDGFDLSWREGVAFAFLNLPAGWRASNFLRAAEARGVLLRPADEYVLLGGRAPNAVRLAINGQVSRENFTAGAQTLRALLNAPPHEIDV